MVKITKEWINKKMKILKIIVLKIKPMTSDHRFP